MGLFGFGLRGRRAFHNVVVLMTYLLPRVRGLGFGVDPTCNVLPVLPVAPIPYSSMGHTHSLGVNTTKL